MAKMLQMSLFLLALGFASTTLGQEPDKVLEKAGQETLLIMTDPPLGYAIVKHPLMVQGKLAAFQIQMMKEGSINKVLVNVAYGDFADRAARQAAYKAYINGFVKGLASEGLKVAASKLPELEKSDLRTPLIAELIFADDKGKKIFVQKRIFFATKAYDVSAIADDAAEMKMLSAWASKVRPFAPPPGAAAPASDSAAPGAGASPPAADSTNGGSDELQTVISRAIQLLEAGDFVGFFNSCVPPDDLKMIAKKGSLDDVAKKFGEAKAPRLVQVLKAAKNVKPTLDPTGTIAVFEIQGMKPLRLKKIADHWYIQN